MSTSQQQLRDRLQKAQQRLVATNRGLTASLSPRGTGSSSTVSFTNPKEIIAASRRTTSDLAMLAPLNLNYFQFQLAGIEFLASHTSALLADEMGLGKSIQICGLLNHCPQIRSVLIVCPASVKINWYRELTRWQCTKDRSISICGTRGAENNSLDTPIDIVLVNYDLLAVRQEYLRGRRWDLVVFDEGHYLKNRDARRTQVAKDLASVSKRKVILTGTPLLNRPSELWSLLNLLDPLRWRSFYSFAHRYCAPVKTSWGWNFDGASNQKELSLLLRERYMMRRRKKDVLPQLPPVTRQVIPLSTEHPGELLWSLTLKLAELFGFDPHRPPFAIDPTRIPFELISEIRHETGRMKVSAAIRFIEEEREGYAAKVVIFAHHTEVLNELYNAFASQSVLVTGQTSASARQEAIDQFQNDSSVKYFVASTRAMGLGVTLTAASHAIVVEPDWTPGVLEQAEARLARIGQHRSVLAQYLVLENSLDEKIFAAVQEKMQVINQIIEK